MKIFSSSLAFCEGSPPVTGGFPSQKPVTWSFYAFFDLCLNKRLNKHHCAHYDVAVIKLVNSRSIIVLSNKGRGLLPHQCMCGGKFARVNICQNACQRQNICP